MASDLGAILGPLAAGLLADHVSFGAALGACAVVLLAATVMSVRMPETLTRT
jgi:dipeptide/tripeptide permease